MKAPSLLERAVAAEIARYLPPDWEVDVRSAPAHLLVKVSAHGSERVMRDDDPIRNGQIMSNWCRATASRLVALFAS